MGGDLKVVKDPDMIADNARTFFLSGIFKWMVPFGGRPSPHAIIIGQWKPSKDEMAASIPNGYGAIMKLVDGSLCGSRSAKAKQMVEVW